MKKFSEFISEIQQYSSKYMWKRYEIKRKQQQRKMLSTHAVNTLVSTIRSLSDMSHSHGGFQNRLPTMKIPKK